MSGSLKSPALRSSLTWTLLTGLLASTLSSAVCSPPSRWGILLTPTPDHCDNDRNSKMEKKITHGSTALINLALPLCCLSALVQGCRFQGKMTWWTAEPAFKPALTPHCGSQSKKKTKTKTKTQRLLSRSHFYFYRSSSHTSTGTRSVLDIRHSACGCNIQLGETHAFLLGPRDEGKKKNHTTYPFPPPPFPFSNLQLNCASFQPEKLAIINFTENLHAAKKLEDLEGGGVFYFSIHTAPPVRSSTPFGTTTRMDSGRTGY